MKKIPTLFTRTFENHRVIGITPEITTGCEEAFLKGEATAKFDGSCCAIIDGVFYKRYDAKKGKTPPANAIPCCDPDPVTGHWPHWVPVDPNNPQDKWFVKALDNTNEILGFHLEDYDRLPATYEAVGPHFNGNPHGYEVDSLVPHGVTRIKVARTFDDVRDYLEHHPVEGIVFWLHNKPVCKIKRSDFGFEWPVKK